MVEKAKREVDMRELLLRQPIEHIALILPLIQRLLQHIAAVYPRHTRVVPGHDHIAAQHLRALKKLAEFQIVVAVDAGVWRAPGKIAAHELLQDLFVEFILKIEHIKGDAELICHAARVRDVLQRAAGARAGDAGVVVGKQLHRAADAVIALLKHQLCGDAAVHAAAHGNERFHLKHHSP